MPLLAIPEKLPVDSPHLTDWAAHFQEKSVSRKLLQAAFPESSPVQPWLNLYRNLLRLKLIWPNLGIQESWQLHALSGERYFLQKLFPSSHTDSAGNSPLFYLVFLGDVVLFKEIIQELDSDILRYVNNDKLTFLHVAAASGSLDMIKLVYSLVPELRECITKRGNTFMAFVAASGSLEAFKAVYALAPNLIRHLDKLGRTTLHFAAKSGSPEIIRLIWNLAPELSMHVSCSADGGYSFLHYAISSGSAAAFKTACELAPQMMNSIGKDGNNILYFANDLNCPAIIHHLLTESPELTGRLWKSLRQDPANLSTQVCAIKVLKQLLQDATLALLGNVMTDKQLALIGVFFDEWKDLLLSDDILFPSSFFGDTFQLSIKKLPSNAQVFLKKAKALFKIKEIQLPTDMTSRFLRDIYNLGATAYNGYPKSFWGHAINSQFFDAFRKFVLIIVKIDPDSPIPSEGVRCLNVILNDAQRNRFSTMAPDIDTLMLRKLLSIPAIQALRPRPASAVEEPTGPDNFQTCFKLINDRFRVSTLNENTRRIINTILFPGIKHLMTHQDQIAEHMSQKPEILYYLDKGGPAAPLGQEETGKLPLHANHVISQNFIENRDLLNRILANFFGAFRVFDYAGRVNIFFEELCVGYCLEIRISSLLEKAATYSHIKSFDDFMTEVIQDYFAYSQYFEGKTQEQAAVAESTLDFILSRYKDLPCTVHETYAPNGSITPAGVSQYLSDILCYETLSWVAKLSRALPL